MSNSFVPWYLALALWCLMSALARPAWCWRALNRAGYRLGLAVYRGQRAVGRAVAQTFIMADLTE